MKTAFIITIIQLTITQTIYNFTKDSPPKDWLIVDDVVMGGVSSGQFKINEAGNGLFSGYVSTENNGGFSSVRHYCNHKTQKNKMVVIRLKGDGKTYQLRIKDKRYQYYSYINTFKTSGEWETIKIELQSLYPSFRGLQLNLPNFEADTIEEVAFLIGNKKNEKFALELDKIELK